jgi:hypothetical protein
MGNESLVPQKITDFVTRRETVTVEDLMQNFNVSRITAKNYLSRLAKMDVARRIGRGLYQAGREPTSNVELPRELLGLAQDLKKRFPMADFVIWSINMLADYAHYAISRDLIVAETNKALSVSMRDALIQKGYHAIVNPEKRDFREYADYSEKSIFVLERNETYGLLKLEGLCIPALERIWTDVYYFVTRNELNFSPGELGQMFANMLQKGRINFNRLLRYARRRNLRDEIIIFLYNLKQWSQFSVPENVFTGRKGALEIINEMVEGAKE